MHLLGFFSLACSLFAAALLPGPRRAPAAAAAAFESGLGFSDAETDAGEAKAYAGRELEEQLRSASSVDELMTLLYPESWKMYKCQLRKGGWQHSKEQANANTRTEGTLKFAAAHYNPEILKSIDTEWRKTQCVPREVCVDVGKEFGAATNTFFKPPCVSVYRCGGCCNSEGQRCTNTSASYLSKALFEITVPLSQGPKPVTISFANHTSCRCMSKLDVYRQVHSIIRRSLPATLPQCQAANKTCPTDYIWNNHICRCLAQQDFIFSSNVGDDSADGFHNICGPNKELDEETCQCVCRGGLWPSSCGPHKELDRNSCQCVCKNKLFPNSCAANREFDENTCQCVCKRTCPRNQPLNPGKCACECTETPQKCFLKGKKFQHQTCSCYRRPCTNRVKHCEQGLSFSEEVCRCVPSYWKRPHMN
ncbi:vascular endothelial growth factor C [Delphinapterus leucas]|uniref:Vascular endothelial growth factor C n=1 Tax=Delphinapterus leucas TaxID=9749 RepID=A0A2Y9N035_DELLE|nr:vascular endothelial growth factor C [Delphinapterus leucas]